MKNHRKRSRKEIRAIKARAKKDRPYKVGPLSDGKDVPNFLAGDRPHPLGGTRPLLVGDAPVSEGKTPIAKGKHVLARHRRLLKRAD
jgi:hypothetical protein